MAEPDSDPRNTVEDEDLEDGEIETDEENDVIAAEIKPPPKVASEPSKKQKNDDELKKTLAEARAKSEHRKTIQENSAKSKKLAANDAAKGKSFDLIILPLYVLFMDRAEMRKIISFRVSCIFQKKAFSSPY